MAHSQAGYALTLEKFLNTLNSQPLLVSIEGLVALLKRKQIRGDACAKATANVLLQVVAKSEWQGVDQLIMNVQRVGTRLVRAHPQELLIGNIVRRVLGLIRDEAAEDRNADHLSESVPDISKEPVGAPHIPVRPPVLPTAGSFYASKSMINILLAAGTSGSAATSSPVTGISTPTFLAQNTSTVALRSEVIDGIQEILDEISQADDQIASFADLQIQSGDHVLVYDPSPTVERFLLRASQKRSFTAFISLSRPATEAVKGRSASWRKKLNNAGVKTITLGSGGVAAYMPKMSRVILSARAVLGDGSVLADAGAAIVARAAYDHKKPVIILSAVYKLSPEESIDSEALIEYGDPSSHVSFADGTLVSDVYIENITIEFMPATLVDCYITNLGSHVCDQLGSVITDHYKDDDFYFYLL